MAYSPITRTLFQFLDSSGDLYSGAVLKAYAAGTSTNISFATDNTGATLVSSIALNASGYPEVSGNIIIPHIDQNYRLSLYPTQAAADSNTGALWDVDNIVLQSLDAGNNKVENVADGTARSDGLNVGQVQDGEFNYLGTTSGSADAYTLAPVPAIAAYKVTMRYTVKIHVTNATTTPYLQISSIASPSTTAVIKRLDASKAEIAVMVGDLKANGIYTFQRNATNNSWILLNPEEDIGKDATTTKKGTSFLSKQITISNNSIDADHDIDISAGVFQFDDGSGQATLSAITKQLDAAWAEGDHQGGLDTGAIAANTWYYVYAIHNPTTSTSDALFTTTYDSPTMPSGYTLKEYKGAIRTDGSSNIRRFTQAGKYFFYLNKGTFSEAGDYVAANVGTGKVDVTTLVPPQSNILADIIFRVSQTNNNADRGWLIRSSLESDAAPISGSAVPASSDKFDIHLLSGTAEMELSKLIKTDNAQVWYRTDHSTDTNTGVVIITKGWFDYNL